MGFYINTDNPRKDIRTLNNATCQFWSILTALTINKLHNLIDEYLVDTNDIQVTSTIYDSIYGIVYDDPEVIAWLNHHIVKIMETDFMENQIVKNEAQLEIGKDWSDLHPLPKDASEEVIKSIIKEVKNGKK